MDTIEARLFSEVSEMQCQPALMHYEQYVLWAAQFGDPALPERDAGKLEISVTEQKWVVYEAMRFQMADDPDAESVDSGHILAALNENGFCQALEQVVEPLCDQVLARLQTPASVAPVI